MNQNYSVELVYDVKTKVKIPLHHMVCVLHDNKLVELIHWKLTAAKISNSLIIFLGCQILVMSMDSFIQSVKLL